MAFKEVASLDAEVTVALGKKNKETGKAYPKSAEGYFLGSRTVKNKRGDSNLHFLQVEDGTNLGIWGTTDLDRKLAQVVAGTMIRITSTGTKATPNGEMYTYKVEQDAGNQIEVAAQAEESSEDESYDDAEAESEEDESANEPLPKVAAAKQNPAARRAAVQEVLNKGKAAKAK